MNFEAAEIMDIEQLEAYYSQNEGPQGERLTRARNQQFRNYIDYRIQQVNLDTI